MNQKKKRKKKAKKRVVAVEETKNEKKTDDNVLVEEEVEKGEQEAVSRKDGVGEADTAPIYEEASVEKEPGKELSQPCEFSKKTSDAEPTETTELDTKPCSQNELNATNLEKLEDPTPVPEKHESLQATKNRATTRKANKKQKALILDAKKEYEQLKAKAIQMFAVTTCSLKPKKQKKRKNAAANKSKETVVSDFKEPQPLLDNAVTPSTVASFTPQRSQTPNKEMATGTVTKSITSPQSEKNETWGRRPSRWSKGFCNEGRKKPWKGREVTYRRKAGPAPFDPDTIITQEAYQTEEEMYPRYYQPIYFNPKLDAIAPQLNAEITATIAALDAYNKELYPVCESIRLVIEKQASIVFQRIFKRIE